ncbi:hypothetical protein [Marinibacterium profundimaris]|uniref:Uncharacterized protein n=1 Tax=Marinibacterium profundimaris TaxID=1679460 RepID=A0A225NG97_9RHOB|nr:hypothetical protein [Marinibacterium profundimaris]MAU94928.1 hypothetical protein [Fulvimarina sp.]OWU68381.1 hypothetical protein ATO3_24105 [Marinibacterium profundimaris]
MKTLPALFAAAAMVAAPTLLAAQPAPTPAPAPSVPAPLAGDTDLVAGTVIGATALGFLIVVIASGDSDDSTTTTTTTTTAPSN